MAKLELNLIKKPLYFSGYLIIFTIGIMGVLYTFLLRIDLNSRISNNQLMIDYLLENKIKHDNLLEKKENIKKALNKSNEDTYGDKTSHTIIREFTYPWGRLLDNIHMALIPEVIISSISFADLSQIKIEGYVKNGGKLNFYINRLESMPDIKNVEIVNQVSLNNKDKNNSSATIVNDNGVDLTEFQLKLIMVGYD